MRSVSIVQSARRVKRIAFIIFMLTSISLFILPKSRAEIVSTLFKSVENWMGSDYKYGGNSKEGIDCSSFISQVYNEVFAIDLPRTVKDQRKKGKLVTTKLQPGDILFFNINGSISHVGIYVFDDKFIHVASSGPETGVIKSSLKEKYYKTRYRFAKRLVALPPYVPSNKINEEVKTNENVILFGKIFFKGKLLELTDEFDEVKPIYIQIKVNEDKDSEYIVVIEDQKNKDQKKQFRSISNNKKNTFFKIDLKKGNYIFTLISKKENILFSKNIIVK